MSGIARKLRIHGEVQGVFFRAWSAQEARSLGLRGWVRNRSDGTVEMLVQGEADEVERFVARCRRGPPAARVDRIEEEPTTEQAPSDFEKRSTL